MEYVIEMAIPVALYAAVVLFLLSPLLEDR